MDILQRLQTYASEYPDRIAVYSGNDKLTYKELWEQSDALAAWLLEQEETNGTPIAVYGHKHPLMLVGFLGCVKSGHSYCPIDCLVPDARTSAILEALPSKIVLTTEALQASLGEKKTVDLHSFFRMSEDMKNSEKQNLQEYWVTGDATYYIIFTSGSTGTPKGVQISSDCLNHYLEWSVGLGTTAEQKKGQIFLNQAPFSFDLSIMDLYTCLASGGTLYCLEKSTQSDYKALIEHLQKSGANVWVSTPSFADVCLAERSFSQELMPGLQVFLFCGETLAPKTVFKLQERFPNAQIINTYGPTESTVAVTEVLITPELAAGEDALPVGKAKPGTWLEIWNEEKQPVVEGEKGEIIIWGNTVSTGYFGRPDLTEKAFLKQEKEGVIRGYRTGDKGYLKDGMLYYCGRIDLQIKLHGYRIELEDIENNIRKLPGVEHAAVLPNSRGGKIVSLTAYIVQSEISVASEKNAIAEAEELTMLPANREDTAQLRKALTEFLPDYMIPKKYVYLNKMPMTNNGKADRKRLGGLKR